MNRLHKILPRALTDLVREVLTEAPVTILTGARQTGKSTLIRELLQDLLAWCHLQVSPPEVHYWRTSSGLEVDLLVEIGEDLVGVEIKSRARPRQEDLRGLRALLEEYPDRVRHGVVLHSGTEARLLGDRIWGIPLGAVLNPAEEGLRR